MFRKVRPRYVLKKFGKRKFPQKPRNSLTPEEITEHVPAVPLVSQDTLVSSIGSCFASEILRWLNANNFNVITPNWGMVYNPRNIKLIIKGALQYNTFNPTERFWDFGDGDIRTPYIKSENLEPQKLGENIKNAHEREVQMFLSFKSILTKIDVLIITLGQTEYWCSEKEYPFYAAPWGSLANTHNHMAFNLSQTEVKNELLESISLLKKHNTNLKILISVSPIPLVATVIENSSAYIAAQWAKSKLHSAALEVVEKEKDTFYMPSYELVMNSPGINFKEDGRHVKDSAINEIMQTFKRLYTT